MKRILAALLSLMLLSLPLFALAEAGENVVYQSDFSVDTDGWYPRSMGTATLRLEDGALVIEGRNGSWNSPGRDFSLVPGAVYDMKVMVKQDEIPSALFIVSIAHSSGGVETYENLGQVKAPQGQWVELTGTLIAGQYDTYILYVETGNTPTLSYAIKDFVLTGEAEIQPAEEAEQIPSLKEVYGDRYLFGTAVTYMEAINSTRMDFYASQFAIMTPGNEMKPDSLLNIPACKAAAKEDETAVEVSFNAVKPLMDYCWAHGIKMHGHVFVWHSQTPEAFFHEQYDTAKPLVSREVMLARLENFMRQTFAYVEENYPGMFVSWDIVNEAIEDGSGKVRNSNWMKVVGEDYVERAFEIARKVAPAGILLCYNDYNTAFEPKQTGIYKLVTTLQDQGTIDCYGFQMHNATGNPTNGQLTRAVERIAATGLKLRVSELDVTCSSNSEVSFNVQAECYQNVMKLVDAHADQFVAVQVWGVVDNLSWRSSQYPLLFDAASKPKPAFWAIIDPSVWREETAEGK